MPVCKGCDEDVTSMVMIKIDGKLTKLCDECADRAKEKAEIAEESEAVVQGMMGFKGTR